MNDGFYILTNLVGIMLIIFLLIGIGIVLLNKHRKSKRDAYKEEFETEIIPCLQSANYVVNKVQGVANATMYEFYKANPLGGLKPRSGFIEFYNGRIYSTIYIFEQPALKVCLEREYILEKRKFLNELKKTLLR